MTIHTLSSREFTRDVAAAKRAAQEGPVFITTRGRPEYALLKVEDYFRLAGQAPVSLLEAMDGIAAPEVDEFSVTPVDIRLKPVDLD